jgi:AraC family transcriptional regulator
MSVDAYGVAPRDLRDYFHLRAPALAAVRALRTSKFAVTGGRSGNAYILSLRRKEFTAHEIRFAERTVPVIPFPAGMTSLVNIALDPTEYSDTAIDGCSFYLRRESFDRLADDLGGNRIDNLAINLGIAINDPVVVNLGPCLLSAIERPQLVNPRFVDHVAMALHTHLAQRYGGMRIPRISGRGSLAPWQLRLARDTISAHLEGGISLARMASDCGLSVSHFARAFTCSTGVSPHRWLMQRRVNRAKDLMRASSVPLSQVALACGFCDQCHFTRVFLQSTGMTPSQWRRAKAN